MDNAENQTTNSFRATLAYFGVFRRALSENELFEYLWMPPQGLTFEQMLNNLLSAGVLEKFGFYFLPGGESWVENRRVSDVISDTKIRIALRAAKKIRSVPFLRAIFVCNSVAMGEAKENSDIDFFIVSAPNRVWIARFFCNVVLRAWRLRTFGENKRNRVCLSFFVDENNLDFSKMRIGDDDVYFTYWLAQLMPVYDPGKSMKKIWDANGWLGDFLPNVFGRDYNFVSKVGDSKVGLLWKKMWEKMWVGIYGNLIEKQAKDLQWNLMALSLKEAANKNSRIIINEFMIKLHENDARERIRDEWKAVIAKNEAASSRIGD